MTRAVVVRLPDYRVEAVPAGLANRGAEPARRRLAVLVPVIVVASVRPRDGPHTSHADGAALQRAAPAQRSKLVRGPSFGCGWRRAWQRARRARLEGVEKLVGGGEPRLDVPTCGGASS